MTAINYRRVLVRDTVRVEVSVLRGATHQQEDLVEIVILKPGERVIVERLREFGVEPVTLSLLPLAPTAIYPPKVLNKTAGLEVTNIETVTEPAPQYRISVKNVSTKAAMMFHVTAYRAERASLSGRQGNRDGRPLIAPGDTYVFTLAGSSGSPPTAEGWAPTSHETVEIGAVLWEDGTFEGDASEVAITLMLYLGRRVQLARVVPLFKTVRTGHDVPTLATRLRTQVEALTVIVDDELQAEGLAKLSGVGELPDERVRGTIQAALREVNNGVLSDLSNAPSDPAGFEKWLVEITALYEAALVRFAGR